jgi:V8-like Glu-specific endopeptidase
MRGLMRSIALVVLSLVALSCGSEGERPESMRSAIVGGADANGAFSAVAWLDVGCSGVLVHPRVVLFAGHCSSKVQEIWFGDDLGIDPSIFETEGVLGSPTSYLTSVTPERCATLDEELGTGTDLAYCLLAEPPAGVTPIPIAAGCELEAIEDKTATLVGFGAEAADSNQFGTKRAASSSIEETDSEYKLGTPSAGTCFGDSGGPALIEIAPGDLRVLGVMSSGKPGECGTGWYTPAARHVPWLEQQTALDLSPCFAATGIWQPSDDCRSAGSSHELLETCGPAFSESTANAEREGGSGCAVRGHLGTPANATFRALPVLALVAFRRFRSVSRRSALSRRSSRKTRLTASRPKLRSKYVGRQHP